MRIKFHTASGSMYVIDSSNMTWERVSPHSIGGYDKDSGELAVWPLVVIGFPVVFQDKNPSSEFNPFAIQTTQVVRAELI